MDPISVSSVLTSLTENAQTTILPAGDLTPGWILATPEHGKHVITQRPIPLSGTRLLVLARSLYGGHGLRLYRDRDEQVRVYRTPLDARLIPSIPAVPRAFVPDTPEPSDRLVYHYAQALTLAVSWSYLYDGTHWTRTAARADGSSEHHRYSGVRHFMADENGLVRDGWFTYLPAGHTPHLYVDGAPVLARTVEELSVGDILRLPGQARLRLTSLTVSGHVWEIHTEVVQPTVHPRWCMPGLGATGHRMVAHDRSGSGALYPCEPAANELVRAEELRGGDTVITSYGRSGSTVAEAHTVWRTTEGTYIHLMSTDGRATCVRPDAASRFVLLHRSTGGVNGVAPVLTAGSRG